MSEPLPNQMIPIFTVGIPPISGQLCRFQESCPEAGLEAALLEVCTWRAAQGLIPAQSGLDYFATCCQYTLPGRMLGRLLR